MSYLQARRLDTAMPWSGAVTTRILYVFFDLVGMKTLLVSKYPPSCQHTSSSVEFSWFLNVGMQKCYWEVKHLNMSTITCSHQISTEGQKPEEP